MIIVIHICRDSKANKLCFAKSKRHQSNLLKLSKLKKQFPFFCNNKKLMITLFKTKGSQPHFS